MITKRILFVLILSALILGACSSAAPSANVAPQGPSRSYNSSGSSSAEKAAPPQQPAISDLAGGATGNAAASVTVPNTLPADKRLVIQTVNMSMYVNDPGKSMETIKKLASEMGGYVVSSNLYQTHLDNGVEVPHASVSIRVQAERLDEAMQRIRNETGRPMINETTTSEDITDKYVDLQSRLTNLQAEEAQLKEIMTSALKTDDVLSVYNQLAQVREQIEVIKGQIQYYEQSAALSLINVDLFANEAAQEITIGGWQPAGVAKSAIQALVNTLKFFANAGIWAVLFLLPVLIIIALPFFVLFLIVRAILRRTRKKAPAPEAA